MKHIKWIILAVAIVIAIVILAIAFYPHKTVKNVGGGVLVSDPVNSDVSAATDAILAKDPATLTTDDALAYVKALAEQKQAKEAQAQADQEANVQAQQDQKDALIAQAKKDGYKADGSLADMEKILNRPEWFGENRKKNADIMWAASDDKLGLFLDYYNRYK